MTSWAVTLPLTKQGPHWLMCVADATLTPPDIQQLQTALGRHQYPTNPEDQRFQAEQHGVGRAGSGAEPAQEAAARSCPAKGFPCERLSVNSWHLPVTSWPWRQQLNLPWCEPLGQPRGGADRGQGCCLHPNHERALVRALLRGRQLGVPQGYGQKRRARTTSPCSLSHRISII